MDEARTWFVLLHCRGSAVQDDQSLFDHPGIRQHFEFLERRAAAGELIAAGPTPDQPGTGMTVLDVESLAEAERLAHEDDQAVVNGVLDVTVRPWHVVMTSI